MVLHYIPNDPIVIEITEDRKMASIRVVFFLLFGKNTLQGKQTDYATGLTLHVPPCQNLPKISVAHFGCSFLTIMARRQDLRIEEPKGSQPAPCPSNDQF